MFAASVLALLGTLDVQLATFRANWQSPGLAVAVVRLGREPRFYCHGTARLNAESPVTPDTLFPIGSCTKAFTSALVAKLVTEGKLGWDDPVRNHLPAFALFDPEASRRVTVRDLLSHRTGVPGHDLLWYRAPWTNAEAVARLRWLEPVGEFRGSYHYSSLQYLAVAELCQSVTDTEWGKSIEREFLKPLGMTRTFVTTPVTLDRATGHRTVHGQTVLMDENALTRPHAAGSIYSTPRDLAKWAEFQLRAEGELRETHAPQNPMPLADPGIGPSYPHSERADYALGWVRYRHRNLDLVAHGGVADGFRTVVTLVPGHGVAVVAFANVHKTTCHLAATYHTLDRLFPPAAPPTDWAQYFQTIERREAEAYERSLAERDRARGEPLPPLALDRYAGRYAERAYGTLAVTESHGGLTLTWAGVRTPLEPYSGHFFRMTEGPTRNELVEFAPTRSPRLVKFLGRVFAESSGR